MSDTGSEPSDWRYEPAQDLEQSLAERLRNFPREPDMLVFGLRAFAALIIRAWLRIYHRLEIVGRENLPNYRSFVMVSNHASHLDTLCLLAALPLGKLHRAFPAAAADYFFKNIPRTFLAAIVVNALPFARQVRFRQSLGLCEALLSNPGNILILFPEGTRTTTGEMGNFKPGIGTLLAGTSIPAIPCHLSGAFEAWGKGRIIPTPAKLRLRIGNPLSFESHSQDKDSATTIATQLRSKVESLGNSHIT